MFGFLISKDKITTVNLVVVEEGLLTPKSKMYIYLFSNVSGFRLCCGGNKLPKTKSLHQLTGVTIYTFFDAHSDKMERIKFLKEHYGIGGGYTGLYNKNHDAKGIAFKQ